MIVPPLALAATVYLWGAYRASGGSWILRAFAVGATVKVVAATYIGWLAIRRIIGLEQLDWTPAVSALAVLALEVTPIYYALEFHRRRSRPSRRSGDGK